MKTLYYDCFAGISGDMNLAALADLGVDTERLVAELGKLNLDGWRIEFSKDSRSGIFGTRADVVLDEEGGDRDNAASCDDHCGHGHTHTHAEAHAHTHDHGADGHHHHAHTHAHRPYSEIVKIVNASGISENAKKLSLKIFDKVAAAEAKIHGRDISEVCFHEAGALDSIVDIVGAAICADLLGVENFACSEIELGGGTVRCAHGVLPVPAPATSEILRGFSVKIDGAHHECTTPTGAAILAALCGGQSDAPRGKILATGIGIGHKDSPELPNILRVMLVESGGSPSECEAEKMFLLSANIDDMTPEELAFACSRLLEAGAADVWQEHIAMKKSRAAAKLCVLAHAADRERLLECILANTSTLGVRISETRRVALLRRVVGFESSLGSVRLKISDFGGSEKIKPEFDDCEKIARVKNIPLSEVRRIVRNEYEA